MSEELSYVLVTPYSLRKSRTGGILSRLISRTGLDLVRTRLFTPSRELVEEYAATLVTRAEPRHRAIQEHIRDYVLANFLPNHLTPRPRVLLLVFRGEAAAARLRAAVGLFSDAQPSGENIRATYGDYITDAGGKVVYFEPAVLCPPDAATAGENLKLWARHSDADGGILENVAPHADAEPLERTLVLIKPDNFRVPNYRPGAVIDIFSRTGLTIAGMKVHFMSVAQACEFYGPVLDVLKKVLRERTGAVAKLAVERELGFPIDEETQKALGDILGPINGQKNWEDIVQFMSGRRPGECPAGERELPGTQKVIAIIYEGVEAVRKIREVLGPTDPSKAPPGSIRGELGATIMVNAAHASDSTENAKRETGIIKIQENNLKSYVEAFYGGL